MDNSTGESAMANDRRINALGNLHVLPDEILCSILATLEPHDVGRLSCVSSVMYILCNEEPLWMSLCLRIVNHQLVYKGSWKNTALDQLDVPYTNKETCNKTLSIEGFHSLFLYRRLYRCYTTLNGFSFDNGNVDRKENLSLEEFSMDYDGKKPVLISGLADNWPARESWTREQLLSKYPDTKFRISQRSKKKIRMSFKDYMSYTEIQHDEDPLYIFDDKFGELEPDLLKDYNVPHLFKEDYFDVLDIDQRPDFRWLIIGPERSGASWHVDPALTSAWNTLLCGRKRWAMYPPGRVPLGVTVHVNEDDGDVNIETPTSLQWWLDFYPLLADDDKPIECTQLPGETIYVPSGWWHCVLNLETTIAVTQNFVNSKNFEFVCLDMAPGYRHKGVCRAGLLALDEGDCENIEMSTQSMENNSSYSDLTRKQKRVRVSKFTEEPNCDNGTDGISMSHTPANLEYSYDINLLAKFLDKERDHYSSLWSSSNCIGQRELRHWLWKLWVCRSDLRDLIWKGACLALNAEKWLERLREICAFHALPLPLQDEILPVGSGSNPVYLVGDNVIKLFAEEGPEACLYGLGSELELYNLLSKLNSPLMNHVPAVVASGILLFENGSYRTLSWDGSSIPVGFPSCNFMSIECEDADYPFGVWGKKQFEYRQARQQICGPWGSGQSPLMWPYIVTKRCTGRIFAELRDTLSSEDVVNLASFLGEQLRSLHLVPVPSLSPDLSRLIIREDKMHLSDVNGFPEKTAGNIGNPVEWKLFVSTLKQKRNGVSRRLTEWGDPIPSKLIEKVDEYIPQDLTEFLDIYENETEFRKFYTWVHSDVMDDNLYMAPCCSENTSDPCKVADDNVKRCNGSSGKELSWYPSYILDFSNLSIGDPLLDLIPIYLDVFRGDSLLLKQFLSSYKLPFVRRESLKEPAKSSKFGRLSYRAMCYCIIHEDNILGAIFSIWRELRTANSWEEVEERVFGELNEYAGLC